ncbi:putative protein OS=Streptomyces violarus OX=67380 GN=FHS41_002750 PE=4 SV=1 [Streptomyces violarus]
MCPPCGARPPSPADKALLKGLPKVKTDMTWVPWTHRRLSRISGYGAGIDSPGWYGHLFSAPDRPVERWMTKVAGLLRGEDRLVRPLTSSRPCGWPRRSPRCAAVRCPA